MITNNRFYHDLLDTVQLKIRHAQQQAVLTVNKELILHYWEIGKLIDQKQKQEGWGSAIIPKLSQDIKNLPPEIKGFSTRNIGRMIAFYLEYPNAEPFLPQPVAKNQLNSNMLICSFTTSNYAALL